MAGTFHYIWTNNNGTWSGRSHGCSCCSSDTESLSVQQLEEHLQDLKDNITTTKRAIREIKRREAKEAANALVR